MASVFTAESPYYRKFNPHEFVHHHLSPKNQHRYRVRSYGTPPYTAPPIPQTRLQFTKPAQRCLESQYPKAWHAVARKGYYDATNVLLVRERDRLKEILEAWHWDLAHGIAIIFSSSEVLDGVMCFYLYPRSRMESWDS